MSTKIYTAWRVRPSKIQSFLECVREYMMAQVVDRAKQLMGAVKPQALAQYVKDKYGDETFDKFKERVETNGEPLRLRFVLKAAYKASLDHCRNPYVDMDCGVNLYPSGKWAYIIPWGEYYTYTDFEPPEFAEEYGYWNNTDEPEGMTRRRWRTREKNWDHVLDNMDALRMRYAVVHLSDNFGMGSGVQELASMIVGKDASFSSTMALKHDDDDSIVAFANEQV